jgi:Aspartyl protease
MRISVFLLIAISSLSANVLAQSGETKLKSLYDEHHWFQLREEVAQIDAPIFYKVAVEVAFNQPEAEKDLLTVISSSSGDKSAFEAQELLIGLYFRLAKYQKALALAKIMLAQKPDAADIKNMLPTLEVLSSFQDQSVILEKSFPLTIDIEDENLVLPVKTNGFEAHYIFDNGFSLSGMSESEAKRLKLTIHDVKTNIDTMSGAQVNIRIAVVKDLEVGSVHLENVAFYILPDNQPPFNQLAEGRQGILGLPVVLALNKFEWNPTARTFTVLPATKKADKGNANLAFDGTSIFNRLDCQGRSVDFSLDMGAQNTVLYPSFAHAFPDIQANGATEKHRVTGVGGSAEITSLLLPSLALKVGSRNVLLKPAHILLKDNNSTTNWFAGNLGMDLLNQAHNVDIDFNSMTLSLQ